LAASFLQFLETSLDKDTFWYEDDAEPCGDVKKFRKHLRKALRKLPKTGKDIYSYSFMTKDCKIHKSREEWKKRDDVKWGTTALLFTSSSKKIIPRIPFSAVSLFKKGSFVRKRPTFLYHGGRR
jgi:hypothetical protein